MGTDYRDEDEDAFRIFNYAMIAISLIPVIAHIVYIVNNPDLDAHQININIFNYISEHYWSPTDTFLDIFIDIFIVIIGIYSILIFVGVVFPIALIGWLVLAIAKISVIAAIIVVLILVLLGYMAGRYESDDDDCFTCGKKTIYDRDGNITGYMDE